MSLLYHEDDGYSEDTDSLSFTSSAWQWQEPIVIGYAFGAKKMSTMGMVMAEASKAQVIQECAMEDNYYDNDDDEHEHEHEQEEYGDILEQAPHESHPDSYPQHPYPQQQQQDTRTRSHTSAENEKPSINTPETTPRNSNSKLQHSSPSLTTAALHSFQAPNDDDKQQQHQQTTIFTVGASNNINNDSTNLKHIVRYFRSSCSSAAGSMTETTVSTPTIATSGTYRSSSKHNGNSNRRPIRLSFVPLDPDLPLEEQHGGKLDLILHKLTEDILACSLDDNDDTDDDYNNNNKSDSYRRVHRLTQYKLNHPECCMVDDPSHVKTLMSRSDIAHVLQRCLQGVTSTSGMLVAAPKFVVTTTTTTTTTSGNHQTTTTTSSEVATLQQRLAESNIQFPLIAKPLIAAGTKQSHYMTVLLQPEALHRLCSSTTTQQQQQQQQNTTNTASRYLLQEYVNHDATLYKVYVLGDFVSVYRRHSLPNLPPLHTLDSVVECVEFDSQRPYPQLSDFGVVTNVDVDDQNIGSEPTPTPVSLPQESDDMTTTSSSTPLSSSSSSIIPVTELEVRPIVTALRQAFGLELFGFDILVTSSSSTNTNKTMLVVDVNYFPSYKEVPNFPTLLARYLTQRVVTSRRRTTAQEEHHD